MAMARRFAIPAISFLFATGLQLSGVQIPLLAIALWSVAAIWGLVAFVTWPPIKDRMANVLQRVADASPVVVRSPFVRKRREVIPDDTPLGFVDFEEAAILAMKRSTSALGEISKETVALGRTLTRSTPRVQGSIGSSPETKRRVFQEIGTKIDSHARRMEERQAIYRAQLTAMSTNYLNRLEYLPASGAAEIRPSIVGMRDAVAEARPSTVGYRDATIGLRNQNVQQAVNRATDRLIEVLGRIVSDLDTVTRFTTSALRVIDAKISAETVGSDQAKAGTRRAPRRPRRR